MSAEESSDAHTRPSKTFTRTEDEAEATRVLNPHQTGNGEPTVDGDAPKRSNDADRTRIPLGHGLREGDDNATLVQVPPPQPANQTTVIPPESEAPTRVRKQLVQDAATVSTMPAEAETQETKTLRDPLTGENLTASSSLPADRELGVGVMLKERFVLKEVLGRGGMGTVFKALDLRKVEANDREPFVALKVLNRNFRDNPVSLIALQRETRRAQTLSHPNIITVYDFDRDGAHVFMTMELLQGRPLHSLIRDLPEGGMPFRKAWPIIEAMGAALAHAHKKNIVHSDFKPGNVFITLQNEAKVLDFGIATAIVRADRPAAEATVFNARDLGAVTPAYASLEQLRALPPDPRDDIYALACVSYELLSGKHPFGKLPADKALELSLQPKPIPGLKRNQWKALQRGLALRKEDRLGSVAEFLRLLQPHSRLFYVAWASAILAATVTAANIYLHVIAPPTVIPPLPVELTLEQQRKVDDLLELADIHFEVGYLTAPTGSNALWAYREVLKIDPYNEKAINGLRKIADAEEQSAWELYEKGERSQSLKKVLEGLEAEPHHEGLMKLKGKLEK